MASARGSSTGLASEPRLPGVCEAGIVRLATKRLSGPHGLTEQHNTFARRQALAGTGKTRREREEYAPPEPERTTAEALDVLARAMTRREAEDLALQQIEGPDLAPRTRSELSPTPLSELPEAAARRAATFMCTQLTAPIDGPGPADHPSLRWPTRGQDRGITSER